MPLQNAGLMMEPLEMRRTCVAWRAAQEPKRVQSVNAKRFCKKQKGKMNSSNFIKNGL